jgi:hypothetical protein
MAMAARLDCLLLLCQNLSQQWHPRLCLRVHPLSLARCLWHQSDPYCLR